MSIVLKNGKVITQERIIDNGGIVLEDNKIKEIFQGEYTQRESDTQVIDVEGLYISPGFIDIHTHGGGGHDFMDGTTESIIEAAKSHMKYGTTSIIPTTTTGDRESLFNTFDNIRLVKESSYDGPNILGLHLEGPYFSYEQGSPGSKVYKRPDRRIS